MPIFTTNLIFSTHFNENIGIIIYHIVVKTLWDARATDEMKRQAQRKLEENEDPVFKDNVTFKYADDEEILKKLSGLK